MADANRTVPPGFCQCGCGGKTSIITANWPARGYVKGEPHRFLAHHQRRSSGVNYVEQSLGHSTPCWIWQLGCFWDGYGSTSINGRTVRAHRVYYEREYGPIPAGMVIDHLCRNRRCVNPAHMESVTNAENLRRGAMTKLTPSDVREIRAMHGTTTAKALAPRYGVKPGAIWAIWNRTAWKDLP